MNKLEELKKEYESINASEEFKKEIRKTIKKMKGFGVMLKRTVGIAAGMAAAFVVTLNCVPSLAVAASDVPVLGSVVKVVTMGRFEFKDKGYEAVVEAPKIEGLLDKDLENKLNKEFKENAEAVIAAFEKDVKEIKDEFGDQEVHYGVDADYAIKTDNEDILAIDTYIVNFAGSSSTKHSFYNIDKKSGRLLELKDMFKEGVDYITPVSDYIAEEMKRRNEEEEGMFWVGKQEEGFDGFEKIKEDQNFYINDSGSIVICFDKYEVAAGAQGCPEFEIPKSVVEGINK
ncbi:MAG: DUF3298 domain-containing protein [Clostridia bacterium]|nr:DUF3298 domain-containing protein [Clostridia bacterium]